MNLEAMKLEALSHPSVTRTSSVGGWIDFTLDQPAKPDPQPPQTVATRTLGTAQPLSSFDIVSPEENAALASAFARSESGYRPDGQTTAAPHPIGTHLDLSA